MFFQLSLVDEAGNNVSIDVPVWMTVDVAFFPPDFVPRNSVSISLKPNQTLDGPKRIPRNSIGNQEMKRKNSWSLSAISLTISLLGLSFN